MIRSRLIPALLIRDGGLVKTKQFSRDRYIGDPINAVRIFNEKEVDELIVLDIDATVQGREPNYELIQKLAKECRMPLCYGGGITSLSQASRIVQSGVEKVAISSAGLLDPNLVSELATKLGSQSVVGVCDVRKKRKLLGADYEVRIYNGTKLIGGDVIETAKTLQNKGVGEILINNIDRDGMLSGYDTELALKVRRSVDLPLTMLGGARDMTDVADLVSRCGPIGAAAGSVFVFKGRLQGVLINYPDPMTKFEITKTDRK